MSQVESALTGIKAARKYTTGLIEQIDDNDWFRQPAEGVTHVAWQVGHLAFAEYRMALERMRGRRPDDGDLIGDEFLSLFRRESEPHPNPGKYPGADEIRDVFDRVHQRALAEIGALSEDVLAETSSPPHRMFETKFGALCWCAQHEFFHAGQIALLRRLFGNRWLW